MEIYTFDETLDACFGKRGTPERERYEAEAEEFVRAYELGEALKAERERMNLTQKELGKRAGVGESTVSKVENGHSTSTRSLFRIFRALGVPSSSLELGKMGRVALW